MSLWAIVPVKPLRRGKSRLAGALTEEERATLNQELLQRKLICPQRFENCNNDHIRITFSCCFFICLQQQEK